MKVKDLSTESIEIIAAKESDIAIIQRLEAELEEYKQKCEQLNAESERLKG